MSTKFTINVSEEQVRAILSLIDICYQKQVGGSLMECLDVVYDDLLYTIHPELQLGEEDEPPTD